MFNIISIIIPKCYWHLRVRVTINEGDNEQDEQLEGTYGFVCIYILIYNFLFPASNC